LPDHGPPDYETKGGKAETMKSETLKPESGYVRDYRTAEHATTGAES
jgi:hypothetical protein